MSKHDVKRQHLCEMLIHVAFSIIKTSFEVFYTACCYSVPPTKNHHTTADLNLI